MTAYNPGIYADTKWIFSVTINDLTTGDPVDISAMDIIVEMYEREGSDVVFTFYGSGSTDTGEVDMTAGEAGTFIVRATAGQHAAVTAGNRYYWEARNISGTDTSDYVANGILEVGREGARKTVWKVEGSFEGTVATASLPGIIITVAGDILVRDTLDDLRAVHSVLARTTYVLGHTTIGDGGAGIFRWDSTSTAADDNGVYIQPDDIASGDAGRYIRDLTGVQLTIEMYGAKGDDATDNTTAIQAALDYVDDQPVGGTLVVPEGTFRSGALTMGSNTTLQGLGRLISILKPIGTLDRDAKFIANKNVDATSSARLDKNIWIKDIGFDGSLRTWAKWLMDSAENEITDPEADYAHPTGALVSGLTLPTLTATVAGGKVTEITVDSGGSGFGTHPTHPYTADTVSVVFTGGGGFGAKASALIGSTDGDITSVFISNPGRGYTSAPTVTTWGGYADIELLTEVSVDRRNSGYTTIGQCINMRKVDGGGVINCGFTDYGNMVIAEAGCKDFLIDNNDFLRCGKSDGPFPCVWVQSHGTPLLSTDDVFFQDSENTRVTNNTARDLERNFALFAPTKGGICSNNYIENVKESGIFIPRAACANGGMILVEGNFIKDVVVSDIVAAGVELNRPAKNVSIVNNHFENCEGGAITIPGVSRCFILNNRIVNCGKVNDTIPAGPFSERFTFGFGTESKYPDEMDFVVAEIGYQSGITADYLHIRGNTITETRADFPFAVFRAVKSGDEPDPLCTFHLIADNMIDVPAAQEMLDDSNPDIFEPEGLIINNNLGWSGFLPRDDKFGNTIYERVSGSGSIFLENQVTNASLITMLGQAGLLTSLALCLDAGDSDSYSGSGQTWSDVSTVGNDYLLGSELSTDAGDPTFNGTAGGLSDSEYFSVDGGDFFAPSGASTLGADWHQDGAKFTVAMVFKSAADGADRRLFATANSHSTGTGVSVYITTSNVVHFSAWNAGVSAASFLGGAVSSDDWTFVAYSIDEATSGDGAICVNNGTVTLFESTYDTPAAGAADGDPRIFAMANNTIPMPSGSRVAAVLVWEDRALNTTELMQLRNALRLRFPSV